MGVNFDLAWIIHQYSATSTYLCSNQAIILILHLNVSSVRHVICSVQKPYLLYASSVAKRDQISVEFWFFTDRLSQWIECQPDYLSNPRAFLQESSGYSKQYHRGIFLFSPHRSRLLFFPISRRKHRYIRLTPSFRPCRRNLHFLPLMHIYHSRLKIHNMFVLSLLWFYKSLFYAILSHQFYSPIINAKRTLAYP